MPPPSDMPDSIRDFVYRNAIQIDAGQDFDDHMARLFRALGRLLEQPAAGTRDIVGHERGEVLPPRSLKRRSKFQFSIALKIAVPVLLAVITSIWYIVIRPEFDRSHQSIPTVAAPSMPAADLVEREQQAYAAAHGNLSALKSYVNGCTVCSFRAAARDEINKLETMEQEDRMYYTSRGNKYALQAYLNVCTVCEHQSAARAEIAALEAAQPKRVSSSAMICGRSVDYVVEDTGIADAYRSFLGVWTGAAWNSRICGGLIVLSADNGGIARVIYIYGPLPGTQFSWKQQTQNAQILNGQLTFRDEEGGNFTFRLREQRVLNGHFVNTSGAALDAVLTRDMASVPQ